MIYQRCRPPIQEADTLLAIAAASTLGFPVDLLTESGAEYYNETGGTHLF